MKVPQKETDACLLFYVQFRNLYLGCFRLSSIYVENRPREV
jgi:hypothetical protein